MRKVQVAKKQKNDQLNVSKRAKACPLWLAAANYAAAFVCFFFSKNFIVYVLYMVFCHWGKQMNMFEWKLLMTNCSDGSKLAPFSLCCTRMEPEVKEGGTHQLK